MEILRRQIAEVPGDEIGPLIAGSFFASPSFLNLWRVFGGVPVWWIARSGPEILAVTPGVEFGSGPFKRFQSTPNGCYSRAYVRSDDASQVSDIGRRMLAAIGSAGYAKVFINDFWGSFGDAEGFRKQMCETRLVDIADPDWEPPDSKLRQQIRRAEREGPAPEVFEGTRHMEKFLHLVKLSEQRLGVKQKYSSAFFEALAAVAATDDRVQWVWCEHESRPVASSIFLVEGEQVLHWQVYFDAAMAHLQATKLIVFATARKLAATGVRRLNMGATPPEAEGSLEFKRKWGGDVYRYGILFKKSWVGRWL
ncbi:MAG: GNAT family N-acetyltransferase [Candidatus Zixiibacteriota bacterium]|nr:MAG: GNAT family N-acetyltransferase [candidate division Zixibacteria bacterium]